MGSVCISNIKLNFLRSYSRYSLQSFFKDCISRRKLRAILEKRISVAIGASFTFCLDATSNKKIKPAWKGSGFASLKELVILFSAFCKAPKISHEQRFSFRE